MSDETLPLDFVQYLASSLTMDAEEAFAKLVEWMAHDEPAGRGEAESIVTTSSASHCSSAASASRGRRQRADVVLECLPMIRGIGA